MNAQEKTLGYNQQEFSLFKRSAWHYLLLFSVLYCFLYCTRLNLANAGAILIQDLTWTKSDLGIVTGIFFWVYGVGQLVNGRLSDLLEPKKFVVLAVLLSVLVNVLFAFQNSFVVMAFLWGCNGYFQSMAWTPGITTLTKWWPGNKRGFATGFAHAFSGFGQVAATLSVAFALSIFPQGSWRAAFVIPAVFPFLLLIAYWIYAKPAPSAVGLAEYEETSARAEQEHKMQTSIDKKDLLSPYRYILANGTFKIWLFVAFATGLARYGLLTWTPLYFIDKFHIDITEGLLQSISLPLGMGIGTLVLPWLSDKFCPDNRLSIVVFTAVIGAVTVLALPLLDPRLPMHLLCIEILLFVAGFAIYAISGVGCVYATDLGGRVFSGTSSGVLNFVAYLGAALQSFFYGFILNNGGWDFVFWTIAAFLLIIALLGGWDSHRQNA